MKQNNIPETYELIEDHPLPDLKSDGFLLKHKKSGAHVSVISNDDENKVFFIAFRTPAPDSTGVPHIIEHSVLCGSDKFPVKDPFVELVKGSLNTFLNAITYPDKTVYPVASENDQDFKNLCDVYMDAVLHPNIYHHKEIFEQEGWHYELNDPDGDLTINGVVYNEMKGAFSSPEDVVDRLILNTLHPDTNYGFESGGDPVEIPKLTYEGFQKFHQRLYHPSNAYIYLYGNMDVEERLKWLDAEYLAAYDAINPDSEIKVQSPFAAQKEIVSTYNLASTDDEKDNTYLTLNYSVGDVLDLKLITAFDILDYALLSRPGAPLKQALLDAGIGKDIIGGFDSGIRQPMFSVVAKYANESDKERFLSVIKETLQKEIQNGLPKKTIEAAINSSEFRFREADFGSYPKGLIYGLDVLGSWIYDEKKPFLNLEVLPVYAELRKKIGTGYFEGLIQKYLLDNTFSTVVIVKPEKGLVDRQEAELAKELAAYKNSLSAEEKQKLIDETAHLKQYQEEPSPQEDLEKLPMLKRSDIGTKIRPLQNQEITIDGQKGLLHEMFTNGILYLHLLFDVTDLTAEELSTLGILRSVLGYMDTEHFSYAELSDEINLYTGGIGMAVQSYTNLPKQETRYCLELHAKSLYANVSDTIRLLSEMVFKTDCTDQKRLYEIIAEQKSRLQMTLSSAGHATASGRALSYFSRTAALRDLTSGISYYRLIDRIEKDFEKEGADLSAKLSALAQKVFLKSRVLVSITADQEGYQTAEKELPAFLGKLADGAPGADQTLALEKKNEGFTDASQVQYVARAGNFLNKGLSYSGRLRILKTILSYDYLWMNVRMKGGAYGCMSGFSRNGDSYFVSYRDPKLAETNEVFEGVPAYVKAFDASDRDMTKYIIGTISDMDTPMNPDAKGVRSTTAYLSGLTEEILQKERDEVLSTETKDIRALEPYITAVLSDECLCAIGNETVIGEEQNLFDRKESLL